ncbi:MAG: DUF1256 domain-containing protein, partial [Clostridia bacterium]|nr:DUF1256 domain-containing protein [Clostridia bacterium]
MNINVYDLTEKNVELNISAELLKIFKNKMPVVLCLGNDKVLSDSVGVLVAEKLRETGYNNYVFGGFCNPLNKDNLMCILKKFPNQNFLFIDSSLSDFKNKIVLNKKQIKLSNGKVFNGVSLCA